MGGKSWLMNEAPRGTGPEYSPCDVVVFGATPSGIAAAIAAKRAGAAGVSLVEPSDHVGGRFAEAIGFGEADRMQPESVGGLWNEARARVDRHYARPINTPEPHVHERLLEEWLADEGIDVLKGFQPGRVEMSCGRLTKLAAADGRSVASEVFIDASYHGDLLPLAGITTIVGRESRARYGESLAGVVLKLENPPGPIDLPVMRSPISGFAADGTTLLPHIHGLTTDVVEGAGDSHLQCANLYGCMTRNPANKIELREPAGYDPMEFELLRREIARLGNQVRFGFGGGLPNDKAKLNDNVDFLVHWGLVGGADEYPGASPEERRGIWEKHRGYTHRLLWFLRTDAGLPGPARDALCEWSLPLDEFIENGGWPWDLYAREGRRMIGDFVMTQHDLFDNIRKPDSIALGSFPVDSHAVRRLAAPDGTEVVNEGGYLVIPPVYEIPYRVLLPKRNECGNLLSPTAMSVSRVAFNSLRAEPTWVATGQAAGVAAALAAMARSEVHDVPVQEIQAILRRQMAPVFVSDDGAP